MLIEALLPIVIIIALGFLLARLVFTADSSWELLERLTYYLFFPALLIVNLAESDVSAERVGELFLVLTTALTLITLLLVVLRGVIVGGGAVLSSVYQGSIRFNTYIGLALIEALFGEAGLRQAALCLLIYIPLVNVLSVLALALTHPQPGNRLLRALRAVVGNPLVLACVLGLMLSESGWRLPEQITTVLEILSQPALPLGLLAVGAGIRFVGIAHQSRQLLLASIAKLLVFPALVLGSCVLMDLSSRTLHVLLLLTALPAPPSAYILARQLGGDAALMANTISLQSLLAVLTIPVWINIAAHYFS